MLHPVTGWKVICQECGWSDFRPATLLQASMDITRRQFQAKGWHISQSTQLCESCAKRR